MSDEQIGRSNSLLAELLSVVLDVDDDDRDIIRVVIAITNESAVPISNIESSIDTIGKGSYTAERSISSIGPGLTRNFHFVLGDDLGHWVFNLSHGIGSSKDSLEIGPIRADLRIGEMLEEEVELAGSSIGGGIGGGMIADVFSDALGNFGKVRETIEIKMEFEATPESSSREAENEDEIEENNVAKPSLKPASPVSKSWDEVPSIPPPKPSMNPPPKPSMKSSPPPKSDPLLSPDILNKIASTSSGMTSKGEENARAPPPTQVNRVHEAPPTSPGRVSPPVNAHSESSPSVREAPPSGPPPSGPPPSGPPANVPPSGPPSGPPANVPPSGPPSGPPVNVPPSGPPSGPPANVPPSGPPSGPPANVPPSGPPSAPPANAPPKSAFKKPTSGPPS